MIRVNHVILSLVAATSCLSLGACSTTADDQKSEQREQPEYRTGSNLPHKVGSRADVVVIDPAAIQNQGSRSPSSSAGPK